MRIIDALPVTAETRIVFVGAGGKSTSMFRLARQALADGMQRVIVSASTHLAVSQIDWADHHFIVEDDIQVARIDFSHYAGLILVTGATRHDYRTNGLSFDTLTALERIATVLDAPLLVEGDGSRRRPLKSPTEHEPAIPQWVNGVVVCVGISGLGQPLGNKYVHRPEIFSQISGIPIGEQVTIQGLANVLMSKQGGLKNIPAGAWRVVNLNQVETPEQAGQVKRLSELLLPVYDSVLSSKLRNEQDEVAAVYRQVAGVVLAAGGSARLGRPKQLLDWQGRPFVRVCAETALDAGLSPVMVVVGSDHQEVVAAVDDLPVRIVHNWDWAQGQGTSVSAVVKELSQPEWKRISAAMFLLADQPQIPPTLIGALLEAYSGTDIPVVAPLIDQRRGNPVLFDRLTFPVLRKLEGDAGGRQVFSKFRKLMVPWHEGRDGLDVDTEEDYRRLLEEEQEES
jgi:molybdenum cofactor cytidylyltransferase